MSDRANQRLRTVMVAIGVCLTWAVLATCSSAGSGSGGASAVTSGTIDGIAFSVIDGTIYQEVPDGPVFAGAAGGTLAFDDTTGALGMSVPFNLRLDWEFSLGNGGAIEALAYGASASDFAGSLSFEISRGGSDFDYVFGLTAEADISGTFSPAPSDPNGISLIVTEFYGVDAPGYGSSSSGLTAWPLDDSSPAFNTDILGCPAAVQTANFSDQEVGFRLVSATLVSVNPVDTIIGP